METTDVEQCCLMAMKVGFLTEQWEKEMYAGALVSATEWGRKIDKQNKEYFNKNHLVDKYNV